MKEEKKRYIICVDTPNVNVSGDGQFIYNMKEEKDSRCVREQVALPRKLRQRGSPKQGVVAHVVPLMTDSVSQPRPELIYFKCPSPLHFQKFVENTYSYF